VTNATKANLIAVINAVLLCATLFGLELTDAGIMGVANALGVLAVSLTYKDSPKRISE
jgi:hypothetical protein